MCVKTELSDRDEDKCRTRDRRWLQIYLHGGPHSGEQWIFGTVEESLRCSVLDHSVFHVRLTGQLFQRVDRLAPLTAWLKLWSRGHIASVVVVVVLQLGLVITIKILMHIYITL